MFCGTTNKKITNEHIIARKLSEELGHFATDHWRFGWTLKDEGRETSTWNRGPWKAKAPNFRVNDVCSECNNGWMSQLEEVARPILLPMLRGDERVRLSPNDTRVFERWIVKTAMVVAQAYGGQTTFSPDQARIVAEGGFPWGFHVWALQRQGSWRQWLHLRSTPMGGGRHNGDYEPPFFGFTSFEIENMYFLACHTSDRDFARVLNLQMLLGRNVDSRDTEWDCPPNLDVVRPDVYPDYHSGMLREWQAYFARSV